VAASASECSGVTTAQWRAHLPPLSGALSHVQSGGGGALLPENTLSSARADKTEYAAAASVRGPYLSGKRGLLRFPAKSPCHLTQTPFRDCAGR